MVSFGLLIIIPSRTATSKMLNIQSIFITIAIVSLIACTSQKEKHPIISSKENYTEININDTIKILISTQGEKFDICKPYSHIEVWVEEEKIFSDTSENEYLFLCENAYTSARKLNNNRYEILLEKFEAPDINKLLTIYVKDNKFESIKILPFFNSLPEDIDNDGKKE